MLKPDVDDLQTLRDFLRVPTPAAWLKSAMEQLPLLLIDHAHCERKAASTALYFLSKYPDKDELVNVMSPLAREELLHFEKVISLLHERGISFGPLLPSSYAQRLHEKITKTTGNARLYDQLIVGAIIEARSCERFHALAPLFDDAKLSKFYASLVKAEARHFQDYLRLAELYGGDVSKRVSIFLDIENESISSEDAVFRVHSGVLTTKTLHG